MIPPFINYVTFNRLGLTARNIRSILDTNEDFEMHIIDSNSQDNTWDFIQSLTDPRIKSKVRFPVNGGPIYAVNFNLTKRKPDQYFFTIDNDVYMKTKNWISRFMEVFSKFPEVGLLGVMRAKPYPQIYPPVVTKIKDGVSYLELKNAKVGEILDFAHGCCMCLRPELIKLIGYWSEENGYGDAEICPRVHHYTPYKVGFMTDASFNPILDMDMTQYITCDECTAKAWCKLNKPVETCFSQRNRTYKNEPFAQKFKWKYLKTFEELEQGKRTAYCASILDPNSQTGHLFHKDWALENINYYVENAN